MAPRSLLSFLLPLSVIFAVAHYLAVLFGLYIDIPYFDKGMHFAGGIIAGLLALLIVGAVRPSAALVSGRSGVTALSIIGALLIGLAWEAFEYSYGFSFGPNPALDAAGDVVMDVLGALFGAFYVSRHYPSRAPSHV